MEFLRLSPQPAEERFPTKNMIAQKANPLVTVVVPCFNVAPYLALTFKSVQAQTFRDYEVIMVDDGSTDGTLAVMQEFASRNESCTAISMPKNQGGVAARNAALMQARGEYIAMLDGDDIWTPNALALRVEMARHNALADVIVKYPPYPDTFKLELGSFLFVDLTSF